MTQKKANFLRQGLFQYDSNGKMIMDTVGRPALNRLWIEWFSDVVISQIDTSDLQILDATYNPVPIKDGETELRAFFPKGEADQEKEIQDGFGQQQDGSNQALEAIQTLLASQGVPSQPIDSESCGMACGQELIAALRQEVEDVRIMAIMEALRPPNCIVSSGGNGIFTYTPPVLANFAWINQESAVATQVGNFITLTNITNVGDDYNLLVKTLATRPCTITAWFIPHLTCNNYVSTGIVLRDSSTGKFLNLFLLWDGTSQIASNRMNSPTSWDSNTANKNIIWPSLFGLRFVISDASPNVASFQCSWDGSVWYEVTTEAFGTFCTPDQVGFCVNRSYFSAFCGMTLLSWKET